MVAKYYHVQRTGRIRFHVGQKYTIGERQNFFFQDLCCTDTKCDIKGLGALPLDTVLSDYFDDSGFYYYRKIRGAGYTPNEKGLLRCANTVMRLQAMLLREFVYEEVRQEYFNQKPSRQRCAWLIPHEERILEHWCATAPEGQYRVYEIEANGNIHIGASKYLKPECIGIFELRENARRFWSHPVDVLTEPSEILFIGEMKPLRELSVPGSKRSVWTKVQGS